MFKITGVAQGLLSTAPLQRAGTADMHVNIPALATHLSLCNQWRRY